MIVPSLSTAVAFAAGVLAALTPPAAAAPPATAAATTTAPTATAAARERLVHALPGGWVGRDNETPFGRLDWAFVFEKQEDGRLAAQTVLNSETWFEIAFHRAADGRWLLEQTGAMEGLGKQSGTLVPVDDPSLPEGVLRWAAQPDPTYLTVDAALVSPERLSMKVRVRGRDHAEFSLDRVPDAQAAALAAEFRRLRTVPPGPGRDAAALAARGAGACCEGAGRAGHPAPDGAGEPRAIARARAALAAAPGDATALTGLARTLVDTIQAEPASAPRYAFELLATLEKAVAFEPPPVEALHMLTGYYVNAPAIAGGSLDKAEATARRLASFDRKGSETWLAAIAGKRAGAAAR